jgi:hypothetical protein
MLPLEIEANSEKLSNLAPHWKKPAAQNSPRNKVESAADIWTRCGLGRVRSAEFSDAAARSSQLPLEMRALAATADAKRRSAGQRERIDAAIDLSRLLGVAEAE